MGISWVPDVPHIRWNTFNTVNVSQLLCWVQDLTWTESDEGHPRVGGMRGLWSPSAVVLEDESSILRTCLTMFLHASTPL